MIPLGILSAAGSSLPALSSNISIFQQGQYLTDLAGPVASAYSLTDEGFESIQHDVNTVSPISYIITLTGTPLSGNQIAQPLVNKPVAITFTTNGISPPTTVVNTDEYGEIVISNNMTLQGPPFPNNYWQVSINADFAGESSPQEIWSSGRGLTNKFYTDQTDGGNES
jgi:hypothetical protein